MFGNIITLLVFVALVVLFAWLTRRAWRTKRWFIKWPAVVLSGLLTLLFTLITFFGVKGMVKIYTPYPVAAASVAIAGTPDQVARGEHMARVLCAGCHSTNGEPPLTGGANLSADTGLPLGNLYPPNITPAGKIKELSDGDIWRILYTGIEPNGRLTGMAGNSAQYLSEDDAKAIIAYLRKSPPVEKESKSYSYSMLTLTFIGAGIFPIEAPNTIQPAKAPPIAVTAEYGQYIVNYVDCKSCHGPQLNGVASGPLPPTVDVRLVKNWTKEQFIQTMRTGVDPSKHEISPPMPWKNIGKLDDVELSALYEYLKNLPPAQK